MSTNFSNTLYITLANALCINATTHSPVTVEVKLPGALTAETAEKPVRKALANRKDIAFAMVTGVEQKLVLCTLSMEVFMENANKVNTRGENGRTRDPMMTRTVESTRATALCISVKTHLPVNVEVMLPGALTVTEAEKPVRKALANRKDIAFAMVTGVEIDQAVYEMPVMKYYSLCERHGEIAEKPFVPYVKRERKSKAPNEAPALSDEA